MNVELIEQADNEIAEYNPVEAGLVELRSRLENVSYDVTTTKGMAIAKADRAEVRTLRTSLEAKRKEIKAPALAHCKLIDEEAKRITAELLKLETPIDEQIKARELVMEAERAAREAAERTRIMAITERIAGIRQYVELAASCRTAARIHELQSKLASVSLEGFEEFADEAAAAHADAMKRVENLLVEKHLAEQEQERIKAEQASAAAKLATERAEFAAQQAAERKALADEQERISKANRDAAILEADRIATERQRLADERQAFEDQVLEAKIKDAQAEAAETSAIVAANKAMLDQQAADAAMIATHDEEVRQAEIVDAEVNPESVFALTGVMAQTWEPSDADCMWEAIKAVSAAFDMTTEQATARLASVQWTL
jgi:DNA-binding PucR family transcriptional regulator